MTDINKITLKNNAMFNIVMSKPNLCKKCLERILGKRIRINSNSDKNRHIEPLKNDIVIIFYICNYLISYHNYDKVMI